MPIPTISTVPSSDYYHSDEYKVLIRSHKDNIIQNSLKTTIMDQSVLYAFKNSQYQFMKSQGVDPKLWWTVSYVNGWGLPHFDLQKITDWYNPNIDYIQSLVARNNSTRS